jgi:hypothetical protein
MTLRSWDLLWDELEAAAVSTRVMREVDFESATREDRLRQRDPFAQRSVLSSAGVHRLVDVDPVWAR